MTNKQLAIMGYVLFAKNLICFCYFGMKGTWPLSYCFLLAAIGWAIIASIKVLKIK